VRRFEYIKGNVAKFWEVARNGETLVFNSGRIGGKISSRTKQLADYMAAEVEYDRQIRDHLRKGWIEVESASEPLSDLPSFPVTFSTMDEERSYSVNGTAYHYLVWRMIETGALERHAEAPDLERWIFRASRRMRLEEPPEPGDEHYEEFVGIFLELSVRDRAKTYNALQVGGFKFIEGDFWIVAGEECITLANALENVKVKRHKPSGRQQRLVNEFAAFCRDAANRGGFEIIADEEEYEE